MFEFMLTFEIEKSSLRDLLGIADRHSEPLVACVTIGIGLMF